MKEDTPPPPPLSFCSILPCCTAPSPLPLPASSVQCLILEMKLQAVMENLHRQQRAKLLMELEQQKQQQAAQNQLERGSSGDTGAMATDEERMASLPTDSEHAQIAALAAMRAAAAGLQRQADSPMSERSSVGDEEDDEEEDEAEEPYKDMMGSEEEEQL